jgi:hypothetical protein
MLIGHRRMCYISHVYHRPCRHWGRDRFVGEPCYRSRRVDGYAVACTYAENVGSVNSSELCGECRYRMACGLREWPFGDIGEIMGEDEGEAGARDGEVE